MTLWLIGMMGSGKTTAGEAASQRLGVAFFDTDREVARKLGCSVAQLWGTLGESVFRDLEKVAVRRLAEEEAIVATGGGCVLDAENRQTMTGSGRVVWLEAAPSDLATRLADSSDRPILASSAEPVESVITGLLVERGPFYEETSTHRIDTTGLEPDEVASRIRAIWNG